MAWFSLSEAWESTKALGKSVAGAVSEAMPAVLHELPSVGTMVAGGIAAAKILGKRAIGPAIDVIDNTLDLANGGFSKDLREKNYISFGLKVFALTAGVVAIGAVAILAAPELAAAAGITAAGMAVVGTVAAIAVPTATVLGIANGVIKASIKAANEEDCAAGDVSRCEAGTQSSLTTPYASKMAALGNTDKPTQVVAKITLDGVAAKDGAQTTIAASLDKPALDQGSTAVAANVKVDKSIPAASAAV